jgi:mannan endo-1,4-beta-mannosidase
MMKKTREKMKMILSVAIVVVLTTVQVWGQKTFKPVNKNASPEAKALLATLYSINGKNIISGHHNGSGPDLNRWHKYVEDMTGKSPEIWGSDFGNYYREGNPESLINEAVQRYKDGYIVTLMWHTGRPQDNPPFDWATSTQGEMSDKNGKI